MFWSVQLIFLLLSTVSEMEKLEWSLAGRVLPFSPARWETGCSSSTNCVTRAGKKKTKEPTAVRRNKSIPTRKIESHLPATGLLLFFASLYFSTTSSDGRSPRLVPDRKDFTSRICCPVLVPLGAFVPFFRRNAVRRPRIC